MKKLMVKGLGPRWETKSQTDPIATVLARGKLCDSYNSKRFPGDNWFFLIPFHNHNWKGSLITADQLKEIMDMSHMKNMRETLVKKLADGLGECMRWPKAETLTFDILLVAALFQRRPTRSGTQCGNSSTTLIFLQLCELIFTDGWIFRLAGSSTASEDSDPRNWREGAGLWFWITKFLTKFRCWVPIKGRREGM